MQMSVQLNSKAEIDRQGSLPFVLVALLLAGLAAVLAGDMHGATATRTRWFLLGLGLYAVAGMAWLLAYWHPSWGRWFISLVVVALLALTLSWWNTPALFALTPLPVLLAMVLLGFRAATAIVCLQQLLWVIGLQFLPNLTVTTVILNSLAGWATLGLLLAMDWPLQRMLQWSWQHYERMQHLLEETRDRKQAQQQVLDELVHANRQLDLLNERLAAMRLLAEEAHKAKATFVAKVSHEFRTPLNMIIGLIDLWMDTPAFDHDALPAGLLTDLQVVHRNCVHLSNMINDVLDLSQSETGRLVLHREWVDLREEIQSAVSVVRPLLNRKQLYLHLQQPDELPAIYCDRTRIRQVLLNLLSNAVRYTERGGIEVAIQQEAQAVVVRVTDSGPGIAPADAERIFEPFYQATSGFWRDRNGSGLGLTISRQFIELHDGRIWLESEPGVGSMFAFKLPIFPVALPVSPPTRWINGEWLWHARDQRPPLPQLPYHQRVVVCDPTGEVSPLLAKADERVEFVEAEELGQALQALALCPAHALIINTLTPTELPSLMQRAKVAMPDTPILGVAMTPPLDEDLAPGVLRYLLKPITRGDLRAVLQAVDPPVRRVLLIDDDPEFCHLVIRLLRSDDATMEIAVAADGEEGWIMLLNQPPDLILLDLTMPNLTGWQLLERKQRHASLCTIPVTIISAQDPLSQPMTSDILMVSVGQGISPMHLLHCSLAFSALLLTPESTPSLGRESTLDGPPASGHRQLHPTPTPVLHF